MKPSASSDCNSGGNTATTSSITASLIGPAALVEARRFQQPRTVGRGQHDIEGDALMMHRQWHVDAGRSQRPELAVEARLRGDLVAVDGEDHVAGLEFGAGCRPLRRDADDDDTVVDFGRIHAEPRTSRLVDAAEF